MVYDAVGNLINDCNKTRTYDGNNKMVSAVDSGVTTGYQYNANGSRVSKTVGSATTWYIYGVGGELIAEYPANGATNTPQMEYGYRNGQMLIEGGCDVVRWLVADHLGTPRMSVDITGTLANMKRHDYLPFGEDIGAGVGIRTAGQGYSADCIRQKFTGKERDGETGLDYFGARYYSNVQGRFTSPDEPFVDQEESNPQSWNLYSYVRNNPMNATDPYGLWHQIVDTSNSNNVIWVADPGDTAAGLATALGTTESVVTQFFDGHLPIVEGNSYDVTNLASGIKSKAMLDSLNVTVDNYNLPNGPNIDVFRRETPRTYLLLNPQQVSDVKSLQNILAKGITDQRKSGSLGQFKGTASKTAENRIVKDALKKVMQEKKIPMAKFMELKSAVHQQLEGWQEAGKASFEEMKEIIRAIIQ